MSQTRRFSFVVRVAQDRRCRVTGVIERVATGAKGAFTGKEAIGAVIVRMLQAATPRPKENGDGVCASARPMPSTFSERRHP